MTRLLRTRPVSLHATTLVAAYCPLETQNPREETRCDARCTSTIMNDIGLMTYILQQPLYEGCDGLFPWTGLSRVLAMMSQPSSPAAEFPTTNHGVQICGDFWQFSLLLIFSLFSPRRAHWRTTILGIQTEKGEKLTSSGVVQTNGIGKNGSKLWTFFVIVKPAVYNSR